MVQGLLLAALGGIVVIILAIVGVVGWVILKLMKGELNLKIGNTPKDSSQK